MGRVFALACATALLAVSAPAYACWIPQEIIKSEPQEPRDGYVIAKLRIENAAIDGSRVLALEGTVIKQSASFEEGALVRFVVPDGWPNTGSCSFGPSGETLNEQGQAIGYVQLRESGVSGFYAVALSTRRNEETLAGSAQRIDWQRVTFNDAN